MREMRHRQVTRFLTLLGSVGFVATFAMSMLSDEDFASFLAFEVFFVGVVTTAMVVNSGFKPTVSWRPAAAAGAFLLLNACFLAIARESGMLTGIALSTGLFAVAVVVRLKASDA